MSAARIPVIGIVGGIGSGKTALAGALNRHFRCCHLDADAAGHRALESQEVLAELRNAFGNDVFDPQGRALRAVIADRVFGREPEQLQARRRLEQIVHPYIRRDIEHQLQACRSESNYDLILLDAALLLEAGWSQLCDAVIFLDVPQEVRLQRVLARGWNQTDLERREQSQMSLAEKKARADLIVDNSQNLEQTAAAVAKWIRKTFELKSRSTCSVATP